MLEAAYDVRPGAPAGSSTRAFTAFRPPKSAGNVNLRWSKRSVWQWSGLSAAAAAIIAIAAFGFQVWQTQLRSDESIQIAMVTIEDRNVLEEPKYRTRGRQQQAPAPGVLSRAQQTPAPDVSSAQEPAEGRFRDLEMPIALLQRAINGASSDKGILEYSELMSYLRAQGVSIDKQSRIAIDDVLVGSVSENLPERTTIQIRVFDLDDPRAATIRSKIQPLPANAKAILLTGR